MRLRWRRHQHRLLLLLALAAVSTVCLLLFIHRWSATRGHLQRTVDPSSPASSWWVPWRETKSTKCATRASDVRNGGGNVVDTVQLYSNLNFLPPSDGSRGFWNRTFEERYLRIRKTWNEMPLEVIVVPHSHADPGWLRTYDYYFNIQVIKILDNMVTFMHKTPQFKFIWSEVSYFSKWWNRKPQDVRDKVIELLRRGQLDITTGGWVMSDEATAHYWAIIDQLVEGHQWLKSAIDFTPTHAWSVDIFGHSSTMPFLLSSSGIKDMVILRTHYAWKAFLASTQQLDFFWTQNFDSSSKILCHMAPSDLYSFKHSCGPDARVCLQYDFRKILGEYSESLATDISEENIRPKAERLLSQYGRFASLFPHNVVLVPLGDDFRYDRYIEWEQQFKNYAKLFHYINNNKDWNARARFGTVSDYFKEVSLRMDRLPVSLPLLKGDFFPYADIYAEGVPSYWTGFYSTRPFWKALARELEHWLRAAEILYSFARAMGSEGARAILLKDYEYLISARQSLALFQHHDAITGTSKGEVISDYGDKLHLAIKESMGIVAHAAQITMMPQHAMTTTWTSQMYPDQFRQTPRGLTRKIAIPIPAKKRNIVLFNTLTTQRQDIIKLKIKIPYVNVLNSDGNKVPSQINPVWNSSLGMMNNLFELIFVCNIDPLSFATYTLVRIPKDDWDSSIKAEVSLQIDDYSQLPPQHSAFVFNHENSEDITLKTPSLIAKFHRSGLLKEVYLRRESMMRKIGVDFYSYLPTPFRSGGYLFHPKENKPTPLRNFTKHFPLARIVRGQLMSEVTFIQSPIISLTTRMYHFEEAPGALEMEATFDISLMTTDIELVMQLRSDIDSKDTFYTDSNGFQILKRKYVVNLPSQANYYPITSAAYVEDDISRLTLLVSQSHGATSPTSGTLEIMLDRRMQNDDNRGMGEGVFDNVLTSSKFWLLLEDRSHESSTTQAITSVAHWLSSRLLYPVVTLVVDSTDSKLASPLLSFLTSSWPHDTHLLNLRTLPAYGNYSEPSNSSLLIIHRNILPCKNDFNQNTGNANLSDFLHVNEISVLRTSLTGGIFDPGISSPRFQTLDAYNVTFG